MKIIIYGEEINRKKLENIVQASLEDLWLSDFIKLELTNDENLKKEMNISKEPALIIEEESIEFKDMIFEWQTPPEEEIKSMLVSIIGWDSWDSCAPSSCSSCWSASFCGI
jgi:hypothetical protein